MSATILPFHQPKQPLTYKERMKKDALAKQTTEAYARRVDYTIRAASGNGYLYISNVLSALFKTITNSQGQYIYSDTYRRSDYNISICDIADCSRIITDVDDYLEKVHVQESPEKAFFMHIRNTAFLRREELRKNKLHLSDSQR